MAVGAGIPAQPGNLALLDELEASFHWSTGDYSTAASGGYSSGAASDLSQAWALLGLSLAGQPVPAQAAGYLLATQAPDGSWGSMDPDTTALAVIALLATGHTQPTDPAVTNALIFFHRTQLANGGWRPSWDTDPLNANSTAWILQALYAAGEDLSTWAATEGDPLQRAGGAAKAGRQHRRHLCQHLFDRRGAARLGRAPADGGGAAIAAQPGRAGGAVRRRPGGHGLRALLRSQPDWL